KQEIQVQELLVPMVSVQEMIKAREFEIRSMETAISKESLHTGAQRVFQKVPRYMRRRAASHNIKRLPLSYRLKAKEQLDKEPPQKVSRRRKRRPGNRLQLLLSKPNASHWLETHIWHAKRMKMEMHWSVKLGSMRNQKSARFIQRSLKRDCLIHDLSYYHTIRLDPTQEFMNQIVDPSLPHPFAKQFRDGSKAGQTLLYHPNQYPMDLIGPVQFFWSDVLYLLYHPSLSQTLLPVLDHSKTQYQVLEKEICCFEFFGPMGFECMKKTLELAGSQPGHDMWTKLSTQNSTNVPEGAIISLDVYDPRLNYFTKKTVVEPTEKPKLLDWSNCARSDLWNDQKRQELIKNKISESDLNKRRQNGIPGQGLTPKEQDAQIPCLAVKNALSWTLMFPKGWGIAFWNAFIYSGAKAIGYTDRAAIYLEQAKPCFPNDYPDSFSFIQDTQKEAKIKQDKHDRTPKHKKMNYQKLNVEHPFAPQF
ncbi:NUC188 domain-containing protein, partial [Gorgonomyces haynaldii]